MIYWEWNHPGYLSMLFIINNNNSCINNAHIYPSSEDVHGATYIYHPQLLDTISRPHLQCTISTPKGAFLAELPIMAFRQIHIQHILHILPSTHLYTWVESSNVDKVSCWRTKVPGIDRNRTRNPLIQSQGFTPNIPQHLHGVDWWSIKVEACNDTWFWVG